MNISKNKREKRDSEFRAYVFIENSIKGDLLQNLKKDISLQIDDFIDKVIN